MAKKTVGNEDALLNAIKDLMIVQLGLAGVPSHSIRSIVGCNMNRVSGIVKHFKRGNGNAA